eukprot:5966159-Karenia_brevis.AAC.1
MRRTPLAKWLHRKDTDGFARVQRLARILCPSGGCGWIPSETMITPRTRKRKPQDITAATELGAGNANNKGSSKSLEGVEILTTPAWLVGYPLLANCDASSPKDELYKTLRFRAFHVLTGLADLACAATAGNKSQTEINTAQTNSIGTKLGNVQFGSNWQQAGADTGLGNFRTLLHKWGEEEDERVEPGLVNPRTFA